MPANFLVIFFERKTLEVPHSCKNMRFNDFNGILSTWFIVGVINPSRRNNDSIIAGKVLIVFLQNDAILVIVLSNTRAEIIADHHTCISSEIVEHMHMCHDPVRLFHIRKRLSICIAAEWQYAHEQPCRLNFTSFRICPPAFVTYPVDLTLTRGFMFDDFRIWLCLQMFTKMFLELGQLQGNLSVSPTFLKILLMEQCFCDSGLLQFLAVHLVIWFRIDTWRFGRRFRNIFTSEHLSAIFFTHSFHICGSPSILLHNLGDNGHQILRYMAGFSDLLLRQSSCIQIACNGQDF